MGVTIQIVCSVSICFLNVCLGLMFAWPSSTLRLFESKNTTLNRPMTDSELALFGSMSSIGALIGTPLVGVLLDRIGRKNTSLLFSLISTLGWAIIAASNQVETVLTAVFISGLSGAVFPVVTVYVSEICQESIRGALTSGCTILYAFGLLLSYLLGGALKYDMMVYVNLSINVAVTLALTLLKESPTYLMANGLEEQATKSIAFYRSVKPGSKEVEQALNGIKQSLNPKIDDQNMNDEEKLNATQLNPQQMGVWIFFNASRSTRRAFYVTLALLTLSCLQGQIVLQVYAEPLFEDAIPNISANTASIFLALVAIVAGIVTGYLTEITGRRPLMICFSILTGVSCLLLGLQVHLHWGPSWLVAANIYFFTTVYTFGGGTVPWVVLSEVFLPQVRSVLTMVVIEWIWFCYYVILFIFNPLVKAIGLGPVFYIFAVAGFSVATFSVIFLPETKGLTVYEIQTKFDKKDRKRKGSVEY